MSEILEQYLTDFWHVRCGRNIPGGRHCLWRVVELISQERMEVDHIASEQWDCVPCCTDGRQSNGMCGCEEVNSDTLARCQGNIMP